ncbi:hypothetical protein Dimus_032557 [Dionaea muscipula]
MQSGLSVIKRAGPGSKLPEDVVVEILARLPVKSLIRFKCVCKRWLSLLESNHMAAKQLAANAGKLECCFRYGGNNGFQLCSWGLRRPCPVRGFKITSRVKMGTLTHLAIAGILDGILCLKVRYEVINGETLVLWNPATGETKQLPPLTNYIDFVGFGWDPRTGHYKILAISIDRTRIGSLEDISDHTSIKAEVYSIGARSSSSSWRVLDLSYFFDGSRRIDSTYLFGTGCRWSDARTITPSMTLSADRRMLSMLGNYRLLGNNGSVRATTFFFSVISFDSSDEVYIETPLPSCESPDYYTKGQCVLRHCPDHEVTCTVIFVPGELNSPWPENVKIWVLIGCGARGSWTTNISVDTRDRFRDIFEYTNFYYRYRQSLVSISQILANEGDYIESDHYISVRGETRTLFTLKLPHTKPWRYES